MSRSLLNCLTIVALAIFVFACGDSSKSEPTEDTGQAADASEDAGTPVFTSAEVSANGATVAVSFEPFSLTVSDAQGENLTRTIGADAVSFSGLGVARIEHFSERNFYFPRLPGGEGAGDNRIWYRPGEVLESTEIDQGYRFVVTTTDAQGQPGPELTIWLEAADHSATLRVQGPDQPDLVHTSLSLEAFENEGFYGFGEWFDRLDARGHLRVMQMQAQGASESDTNEVHVPIPFYMSTRGYSLYVEDRHPGAFEVASRRDDVMRVTYNSRDITYHFFASPEPMQLLESYTDITGKPAHVPFWALAPQWWRNVNESQAEFLDDIHRAREADIPSTMVWIDRPWESYYHNWRFNRQQFPDPEAMFAEAERLGHRILLHHTPHMNVPGTSDVGGGADASEGLYDLYVDNDWLVKTNRDRIWQFPWGGGTGAFVDYTHSGAVEHAQQLLSRATDLGARGTKMDWDEFLQPNLGDVKLPLVFHNGETTQTMKGWYSALYHKTIIEGFDEASGEPTFHVSRSGAAGGQVWNTCIWPGDLDNDFSSHTREPTQIQQQWNVGGMPAAMMANQTLGMSGFGCFASDIGGYRGGQPTEEVLLRWMAFGTFNGVMQLGGGGKTHMAWTADTPYTQNAVDVTRKYFKLRMQLFPYIFHYMRLAEQTGRPLVRSMWLSFPGDASARPHEDQFMFGPDLLVAPVYTEAATERDVYLPAGEWADFWTGERVSGPTTITRAVPLDVIPLYVRRGALIPMARDDIDTLLPAEDADTVSYQDVTETRVHLFASEQTTELDLFNGLSVSATGGATTRVEVTVGQPDPQVDPRAAFAPQTVTVHLEAAGTSFEGGPRSVTVERGGQSATLAEGTDCTDCYSFDDGRTLLTVRLGEPGVVTVQ